MKTNLKRIDDFLHDYEPAIKTSLGATAMYLCTGKACVNTPNSKTPKDLSRNVSNGAPHFVFNTEPPKVPPIYKSVKCSTCYTNTMKDEDGTQYFALSFHKDDILEWIRVDVWLFFNKKMRGDFVTIDVGVYERQSISNAHKNQKDNGSDYVVLKMPFSNLTRHHVYNDELWSYKCPKWNPENKEDMKVRKINSGKHFGDYHIATGKKQTVLEAKLKDDKIYKFTVSRWADLVLEEREKTGYTGSATTESIKRKFYARKDVVLNKERRLVWNGDLYEMVYTKDYRSDLQRHDSVGLQSNKDSIKDNGKGFKDSCILLLDCNPTGTPKGGSSSSNTRNMLEYPYKFDSNGDPIIDDPIRRLVVETHRRVCVNNMKSMYDYMNKYDLDFNFLPMPPSPEVLAGIRIEMV